MVTTSQSSSESRASAHSSRRPRSIIDQSRVGGAHGCPPEPRLLPQNLFEPTINQAFAVDGRPGTVETDQVDRVKGGDSLTSKDATTHREEVRLDRVELQLALLASNPVDQLQETGGELQRNHRLTKAKRARGGCTRLAVNQRAQSPRLAVRASKSTRGKPDSRGQPSCAAPPTPAR